MRLFLFVILILGAMGSALAQTFPDLGPEAGVPSVDDLDTLIPDVDADQPAVVDPDGPPEASELDALFVRLKDADGVSEASRIARQIQLLWLDSGSDTVDLMMARAGQALKAENHALALDMLDIVVTLSPDFAEGWNRR
ncbi:MAG: tetratricopeptide repeat protein, partial [Roseibium sp.]